ncbi:ABC transporter ATP-binding protein [Rhizobium leguminosarum bv. viciae]|nr:ABC transporter ATP-binding protein [Rhizobium leguminosarum bv. viciae]
MSISDAIYRPFETLIRPLDIPYRPMPTKGPVAVLVHFIAMFRGVIITMALTSMAIEAINLTIIWGLSVIVDGVTTHGVELFVDSNFRLLAVLAFLLFPVMPVLFYVTNILNSHTIGISLPVAIQWQGHKAVERQDLAFFHDLFAGQVASRLGQVANAVQQQILIAFQTAPRFLLQIIGSVVLLLTLSWQLALPVIVWVAFNVLFAIKVVPDFTERARRSAKQNSLISGALTDIYGNIQMVKQFAAEDSEAGALRTIMSNGVDTVALLHRSVGDNIRYGRPEATKDEIEAVAKMASADAFIADLSDGEGRSGYDAFVGDRGIKLSGGQRQRVAIARVLLKDAPILVLDEATSALDSESEAAIQERLNLVMEGKTVIAIAHRLSTIARMDRIVVLDRGRIVEEGRPDELVERDGLFARLWKRQTGGFIPEDIDEPLPASPAS